MVLGLRSKTRKGTSVEVDYLVHVQDIKPWSPSKSLKSIESVLLQWENGDRSTGFYTSEVGDEKIEFNQYFRLPVTLCREAKSKSRVSFQKNYLEFQLYEYRLDKAEKGQLLGSAVVNIADYGIVKEITNIYAPLNCKKSFKSTAQPVLFIKVQTFDMDGSQSAADCMSEGNYEETEFASITDDDDCDIPSQSSRTSSSSAFDATGGMLSRKEENTSDSAKNGTGRDNGQPAMHVRTASEKPQVNTGAEVVEHLNGVYNGKKGKQDNRREEQVLEEKLSWDKELVFKTQGGATTKPVSLRSDTLPVIRRVVGVPGSKATSNKLQHVKSVQFPSDSATIKRLIVDNKVMDKIKVVDTQEDAENTSTSYSTSERKEAANGFLDSKGVLKSRVEMLEEELREAAAIEISLYSVVAEHGSSVNKVHAPARRLSRFYLHAWKAESKAKQASAARAAVSGLVLVSKACGNDVTRLAFWLSNSIVLRAIVSKAVEESQISAGSSVKSNGGGNEVNKKFSFKWSKLSPNKEEQKNSLGSSDDWEDPLTFTDALEKIEAWIFSRIVESVWWQTLTPHMQSAAAKGSSRKTNVRKNGLGDQEQGNFSINLWKKAFNDACERLCPIRAGGHGCGCLPVLARLVMEQLVDRLDVAMFNAILRESAEEMPTDPVSDPISDSRVLPISAGKSSFGAGAQLKNAVGNWSRWLTDLFGIDDDTPEYENNLDVDKRPESQTSFKAFHLLNALSDLMMLPLELLADRSTRKEVCPTFGLSLIKRVLYNFVPDEFCPEPIPESVFEALESEDSLETVGESVSSFPVSASPPAYSPPPAVSLAGVIGEVGSQALSGNGSSVLKKSYTSDDELDELDSPISSIISSLVPAISTGPDWMPKPKRGRNVVRYKLLREVWTTEK